jgi:hypothetical protein
MTEVLTYYIDTYINGSFFSRSEPFFEKTQCLNAYHLLSNDSGDVSNNEYSYNIQVSMDLEDYHKLELKSNRIKLKFLDSDESTSHESTSHESTEQESAEHESTEHESETKRDFVDSIGSATTKPKQLKAYRYYNGYIFLKNKRNLKMLRKTNIIHYLSPIHNIGSNGGLFIADNIINLHQLPLPPNTVVSNLPTKYINEIDSN